MQNIKDKVSKKRMKIESEVSVRYLGCLSEIKLKKGICVNTVEYLNQKPNFF